MSDEKPTPAQSIKGEPIKNCGNTGRAWPAAADKTGGKTGNPGAAGGGVNRPDKVWADSKKD